MAHNKVYGICESKCHVQTVAGYASRAALDSTFTDSTSLIDIWCSMGENTLLVYNVVSASASDGIYPTNVTYSPGNEGSRDAIVRIEKSGNVAAVTFMYKCQMWICDIYASPIGVRQSGWVRVV